MSEIAIIGGGAWGTGLAIAIGRKGTHRVRMWVYEKEVCESINQRHENELFLRGQRIPEAVRATNSLRGNAARRGDRGKRDALAPRAPCLSRNAAAPRRGNAFRQRHQGP